MHSNSVLEKEYPAMSQMTSMNNGFSDSPVPAAEVASVRQRTASASLLPRRVYHDPEVLAYELEAWFANGWVCIGREEDIELPGQYFLTKLCDENLIIVRDNDRLCADFSISAGIAARRS